MEQNLEEKQGKYSQVTGEKIKKKSVRKLKKEHKISKKEYEKEQNKLNKRIRKVDKRLVGSKVTVEAITVSQTNLESGNMKDSVNIDDVQCIVENKNETGNILIVRKTEKGRPVTLKRKFLNLISYTLVGLVAVFFGYFAGNFYVANYLNKVDYSAFSEENLVATNGQELYNAALSSNKTSFSAIDLFIGAEYRFNTRDSYNTSIKGQIQPSIGSLQSIWGTKNKNGNVFEVESVSKGMLSIGEKYTYNTETKQAQIYKASSIKTNQASYPTDPTWNMTYDEFRAEYGTAPDKPCIPYIISTKTVIEDSQKVVKEGSLYRLTFSLKTDSSVINYIKQVKHMSGLADYPTFKNIVVTAYINENLEFTKLRFDESYTVMYFGVMATCSGFVEISVDY